METKVPCRLYRWLVSSGLHLLGQHVCSRTVKEIEGGRGMPWLAGQQCHFVGMYACKGSGMPAVVGGMGCGACLGCGPPGIWRSLNSCCLFPEQGKACLLQSTRGIGAATLGGSSLVTPAWRRQPWRPGELGGAIRGLHAQYG